MENDKKNFERIIPITDQLQSTFPYGNLRLPFEISSDDINGFHGSIVNWYKQTELKYSYVLDVCIELQVLEHIIERKKVKAFL